MLLLVSVNSSDSTSNSLNQWWLKDANGAALVYRANTSSDESIELSETASCACSYSTECDTLRTRNEWRSMSWCDQQNFIDALNTLRFTTNENGVNEYDEYIWVHNNYAARIIDDAVLFPWHRHFVWKMEEHLRSLGGRFACISMPWWDWGLDFGMELTSDLYADWGGLNNESCVGEPYSNWTNPVSQNCVRRRMGEALSLAYPPITATEYAIPANSSYFYLYKYITRNPHIAVHDQVGGIGGDFTVFYSSADPLFWVHHASLDRMFAMWQDCFDMDQMDMWMYGDRMYTDLSDCQCMGLDTPMVVYGVTPRSMLNITKLGYRYSAIRDHYRITDNSMTDLKVCKWDWFAAPTDADFAESPISSSFTGLPTITRERLLVVNEEQLGRLATTRAVFTAAKDKYAYSEAFLMAMEAECEMAVNSPYEADDIPVRSFSYFKIPNLCGNDFSLCKNICKMLRTGTIADLVAQ